MENNKKCSLKEHEKTYANTYCQDCKIYMCNKCLNFHSNLFKNHNIYNLDKNIEEIFFGLCQENNHFIKLEYFCKTHNKLCCSSCIAKVKKEGNGQHTDCDVYTIEDIKDIKKNKLKENIKILEDLYSSFEQEINQLNEKVKDIEINKEKLKQNIQNIFTKIRNAINEREDKLLLDVDEKYEKFYSEQNIIKKNEKLPNKIKKSLEKGKLINDEWNENDLAQIINDCINIEDNIEMIKLTQEKIDDYKNYELDFESKIDNLIESINNYGTILESYGHKLNFIFKEGTNYVVSNEGKIATRNEEKGFDCTIIGNKEIPKNKISKWKLKINSDFNSAFIIGIGPENINKEKDFYEKCWSLDCKYCRLILKSSNYSDYNDNKQIQLKEGDIITVEVNRIEHTLSFSVNDINYGIASSNIPINDKLYPIVILYGPLSSVQIID